MLLPGDIPVPLEACKPLFVDFKLPLEHQDTVFKLSYGGGGFLQGCLIVPGINFKYHIPFGDDLSRLQLRMNVDDRSGNFWGNGNNIQGLYLPEPLDGNGNIFSGSRYSLHPQGRFAETEFRRSFFHIRQTVHPDKTNHQNDGANDYSKQNPVVCF